jgi:hypothetical protein
MECGEEMGGTPPILHTLSSITPPNTVAVSIQQSFS